MTKHSKARWEKIKGMMAVVRHLDADEQGEFQMCLEEIYDAGFNAARSQFSFWGSDDCKNHDSGCGGRITLFAANTRCMKCDPESYSTTAQQAGVQDEG